MAKASPKYDQAKAWLLAELADGRPHVCGGVLSRALDAGFPEQTVRRAANALRVKQYPACLDGRPRSGLVTLWQLKAVNSEPVKKEAHHAHL